MTNSMAYKYRGDLAAWEILDGDGNPVTHDVCAGGPKAALAKAVRDGLISVPGLYEVQPAASEGVPLEIENPCRLAVSTIEIERREYDR